jgi:hypothetical protein
MNNVGLAYANVRFEPSFMYDIDPLIGSTAMPGFVELAGMYRFYRIVSSRIHVDFSGLDQIGLVAYVCPVNFDPGANSAVYVNYLSNRRCKTGPIGSSTGNSTRSLNAHFSLSDFIGVSHANSAVDYYTGSTTGAAAPSNNVWWMVGAVANNVFTAGVYTNVRIDVVADFFELASPAA